MPDAADNRDLAERGPGGNSGAGVQDDRGMPPHLVYWGIFVGLAVAAAGALLVMFFSPQVPLPVAALTLCVGFGIVLAAFGSRASGSYGGYAVVGAGALAVVLFLLVENFIPKDPLSFIKTGQLVGDFTKVAALQIIDDDPLYSRRDPASHSIRFIVLGRRFKTGQVSIFVDTTETGEGREQFQLIGDARKLAQKYLASDQSAIKWVFDYDRRLVKDGAEIVFKEPEELDEQSVGAPATHSGALRPLDLIARATAAGEAEDAEAAVKRLVSDDAATRRNARDALVALGPPAVAAMVQALRADPNDYRLRSGVVLSLAEMLRAHEDKRADIAAALTADDLAALVATAGSDKDPTLRLQATDFLYRLKDPRTVAPALDAAKKASGPTEQ